MAHKQPLPRILAPLAAAIVLALAVPTLGQPTSESQTEPQADYPPGEAKAQAALGAGETNVLQVTPKLSVAFKAADQGGQLNVTVTVKWKAAGLPEPLPEAPGVVLSYIQVAGQEDGLAEVRFDCLIDPAFRHDLLYWDGQAWTSLAGRSGDAVAAQADGKDLRVFDTHEADGHFVAVVDHASAFALTSQAPGTSTGGGADVDVSVPAPGGAAFALLLLIVVAGLAQRRS